MIAGASSSSNSTLSVKSPWMSCDGSEIGCRSANNRSSQGSGVGRSASSHATRSPTAQAWVRSSMDGGRGRCADARWKRSHEASTSRPSAVSIAGYNDGGSDAVVADAQGIGSGADVATR